MILSKRKKILFFLVFIIILSSFILYKDSIVNLTGFTILSSEESRINSCENIENDFIKDMCYFTKRDNCYSIENTYLQYMCLRLSFRTHMLGFITTKFSPLKNDFSNLLDECKDYDNYHNLFCIYANVASLAKDDLLKAKHICNQLKDERLIGECNFYIASSIAMNIDENTSKKIKLLMNFCEEVTDPSWRAECYYVLADELARKKSEYLEEIANACRESNLAINYNCFDHISYLLPTEKTIEFCNLLKNTNEKIDCVAGLGYIFGWHYGNVSSGISTCNKFPTEFRNHCLGSLSKGIGQYFGPNVSSGILACNEIPTEFRNDCFKGEGKGIGGYFNRDISSSISACNQFPPEFRNDCFNGLRETLIWYFGKDIPSASSACNKFPPEFRNDCFLGLSEDIGRHFGRDFSSAISTCNQFPTAFKSDCFKRIGENLGVYFSHDISSAISTCNEAPTKFRNDCLSGLRQV